MRLLRVAAPLLLLMVAGCGSARPGGQADPLRGHTFLSTEITVAGEPHELLPGTRVSVHFHDDGRLTAGAGCNTMGGPVGTGGGVLDVGEGLAMTAIGCPEDEQKQDAWLGGFLADKVEWRHEGDELTLTSGATTMVLTDREVADPDRPLTGTTWTVDTILDGATASSSATASKAALTFADGTVEIAGGCNTGSAGYTTDGDMIRFENPVMTRMACEPDLMKLEQAVLDVLQGEVTVRIEADRLTLEHPSGKGLGLRA
jgi:heat shock protein HslJ